jgi:hypothetical protein
MPPVTLYRVEDSTGTGPFCGNSGWTDSTAATIRWPIPSCEQRELDGLFAVASPEEFVQWWEGHASALHKHGFRATVYECPKRHVRLGRDQAAFRSKYARKVKQLSVPYLLRKFKRQLKDNDHEQ